MEYLDSSTSNIQYALVQFLHIPCSSSNSFIQLFSSDTDLTAIYAATFDSHYTFNPENFPSPIIAERLPSPTHSLSPGSEDIGFHQPLPTSILGTPQFDHDSGRRSDQVSLHEQFADIMDIVQRLPSGEPPKNALFKPFFKRDGDRFVCLLCPARDAKILVNRTQIIQHIAGGHGKFRPFACPSW